MAQADQRHRHPQARHHRGFRTRVRVERHSSAAVVPGGREVGQVLDQLAPGGGGLEGEGPPAGQPEGNEGELAQRAGLGAGDAEEGGREGD